MAVFNSSLQFTIYRCYFSEIYTPWFKTSNYKLRYAMFSIGCSCKIIIPYVLKQLRKKFREIGRLSIATLFTTHKTYICQHFKGALIACRYIYCFYVLMSLILGMLQTVGVTDPYGEFISAASNQRCELFRVLSCFLLGSAPIRTIPDVGTLSTSRSVLCNKDDETMGKVDQNEYRSCIRSSPFTSLSFIFYCICSLSNIIWLILYFCIFLPWV